MQSVAEAGFWGYIGWRIALNLPGARADKRPGHCALSSFPMAGIQISNLLPDSAFDWKEVVDKLIEAESIPLKKLTAEQTKNSDKAKALSELEGLMNTLQDSASALRDSSLFAGRTVSTDSATSTWKSTSSSGAPIGTYSFAVENLATKSMIRGAVNVGQGLSATNVVSGVTIATANTATAISAGIFTINGQQVTVATTDSLQDVFDKIFVATGGDVTASYDAAADKVTFASAGEIILSANNDTSNFIQAMKLANNGGISVTSSGSLGTLKTSAAIASAGLNTAVSGAGSFTINGVTINYDSSTDSFATLLSRINTSGAGVTAAYDSTSDRFTLTNATTGDVGIGITDTGGLLAAMGLVTGGTFVHGENARFTVNGGTTLTSMSNTLDSSAHGITGLSVTVNTETTQTVDVASDVSAMQDAIQSFMDNYNAVQEFVANNTQVTASGGTVSTSILSDNREVESWANRLRSLAFEAVGGLTGTVQRLDNLGIDFDQKGKMSIKNADKLAQALAEHPDDVQTFFQKAGSGFVAKTFNYLTAVIRSDLKQQTNLNETNKAIDTQIATMKARLEAQRETLTNAFIRMLDAQSKAKDQNTMLLNAFSQKNDD